MKKGNTIYLVSASDRYNFGDLLFNYIVKAFLSESIKQNYEFKYVSLCGNNLESIQGHSTIGIREAFRLLKEKDVIIFCGGGLLGHKWAKMFEQTNNKKIIRALNKYIPLRYYEVLVRQVVFKTHYLYPYTISPNQFNQNIKVIYNSVGGGPISGMKTRELTQIKNILKSVTYLSVRDINIKRVLKGINSHLAPDSVILLSEIFSKLNLREMFNKDIQNILDQDYIILHFNQDIAKTYRNDIIDLINWIKGNLDINLFLLPVNYVKNSDLNGQLLFSQNENCVVLKSNLRLFEICALIAHSKLLIGSSLHTNIVACSYGIPHLGITKRIEKVNHFFETWYPKYSIFNSYEVNELPNIIPQALTNISEIIQISEFLKKEVRKNFASINSIIESNYII